MLYKLDIWQGATGIWYTEHTSSHPKDTDKWVLPARLLNISPYEYVVWLLKNYKPDNISFNNSVLLFSWNKEHEKQARDYRNFINKKAREINFQV